MSMQIVMILLPVLCLVGLGAVYAHYYKPIPDWTNRMNMDVFLPALIFYSLATRRFDIYADMWLVIGTIGIIVGSGLLSWPVVRWLKLDWRTFLPPVMFSNCGNMGLPLALFAFGQALMPTAIIVFVTTNLLFFTLGAWLISRQSHWRLLLRSPMVLSTFFGFVVGSWGIQSTVGWLLPIKMMGEISLPLMLFTLGIRMADIRYADWRLGLLGALMCPLAGLLAAALILPHLPLTQQQHAALILFAVLPPAAVNYLLAEKYNQEPARMAAIVLAGNVSSIIFVPLGLGLALRY